MLVLSHKPWVCESSKISLSFLELVARTELAINSPSDSRNPHTFGQYARKISSSKPIKTVMAISISIRITIHGPPRAIQIFRGVFADIFLIDLWRNHAALETALLLGCREVWLLVFRRNKEVFLERIFVLSDFN